MVSLLGSEVVPVKLLDVVAGRKTQGHRFLGDSVVLANADDYEEALKSQYVIANADERKGMILNQIQELVAQHNWKVNIDKGLLEEVTNLVEYPTVFAGSFDENT